MENTGSANHYDDAIDLKELFAVLWEGKLVVITVTAMFALASVLFALSVPNQYKATALLAPAQSGDAGLSSALGQLSGLASLAGVSIGAGESSDSQIAQEVMKSWSFIESFIIEHDIAFQVYAANGWDRDTGKLKVSGRIYNADLATWRLKDESGNPRPPTSWELFERFKEILTVSEDKKTGLVTISVEYYSPEMAKEWLDLYVGAINQHMQARRIEKVAKNISYLEEQIKRTSITEMREVFYTIIEEQIKNRMVAEASPDYAFLVVSPSMLPEKKSQPSRAVICILGTLLGVMLGVLLSLIRHYAKRNPMV